MKIFSMPVFEKWPIEDKTIQLIATSPPYYSLRKYSIPDVIIGGNPECQHEFNYYNQKCADSKGGVGTSWQHKSAHYPDENDISECRKIEQSSHKVGFCLHCNAWQGQHGLEPDYKLYLAHCKLWMQEAIRVLRDDGVIFINLADSYNNSSAQIGREDKSKYGGKSGLHCLRGGNKDYPNKSKLLIPERFVIMCVDELGLILRNHIAWFKLNGMPESCQDRFSKKWESIFFFTKKPNYYFNLDAIRESHKQVSLDRLKRAISNNNKWVSGADGQSPMGLSQPRPNIKYIKTGNQKGKKQQQGEKEFGVYRPYTERKLRIDGKNPGDVWSIPTQPSPEKHFAMWPEALVKRMILCSTKPGDIVLDPFCGSGTTLRVADELNRIGKGIDLGYQDIQGRRLVNIQKELL